MSSNDLPLNSASFNQDGEVHIRLQQRSDRKYITTIQGISRELDIQRLVKSIKRKFLCNGCIVEDKQLGPIIKLQGDKRKNVMMWLLNNTPYYIKR